MANPHDTSDRGGRAEPRLLRAVVLRLLLWDGVAVAALYYAHGLEWLFGTKTLLPEATTVDGPVDSAKPGWPNLRGPTHDAVSAETGLADRWPAAGPRVLWKRDLGRGYSGMAVVAGRVYTQRQSPLEQSLVCLDADSGELLWEHRYGWAYEPGGTYPGPRGTPTHNAGCVYYTAPDGLVGCVRAADGHPLWSVNVNRQFGGRGTEFGYACSPLVVEGKVILPVGGPGASIVALSALDGSTVWASGSEPASYGTALPITCCGQRLVVAFLQNMLAAVDLQSGRIAWQEGYSQGYDEHSAQPLYAEPHLMVMMPFRAGADLYRLEPRPDAGRGAPGDGITARLVRHTTEMSNDTASSVLYEGHVYGFDLQEAQASGRRPSRGKFKCMEFASGRLRWSTDRTGHATLLVADGKLFLFSDKGELILARAAADRYEELGRTKVFSNEVCWTAPALCGGRIYLRSPTRGVCLDLRNSDAPEPDQPDETAAAEPSSSEPGDPIWLIGKEREFPFDPPDARELARWFAWSLFGSLGGAALLAGLAFVVAAQAPRGMRRRLAFAVFWGAAMVLAVAVTPLANRCQQEFTLTWPAALFAVHQLTLAAVAGSQGRISGRLRGWIAPGSVILFIVSCAVYYDWCRRLNLATAWIFLIGFLPSWPAAIPAARRLAAGRGILGTAAWTILAFALYFWGSAGIGWVKTILVR